MKNKELLENIGITNFYLHQIILIMMTGISIASNPKSKMSKFLVTATLGVLVVEDLGKVLSIYKRIKE